MLPAFMLAAVLTFSGYIPSFQPTSCFGDSTPIPERLAEIHAFAVTASGDMWPFAKPARAGWFTFPLFDHGFVRVDFTVTDLAGNESCPVTWTRPTLSVPPPDVGPLVSLRPGRFDVMGRRIEGARQGVEFVRDSTVRKVRTVR